MSNYSSLKATINANVKQNGNQEITGAIMNSVLNAMVDSLGAGYQYKGVATPATNPGTPDYNVFYLASEAGTYTNFGGLVIGDNEVAALVYNGSWSKQTTGAATASEVSQLAQEKVPFTATEKAQKYTKSGYYINLSSATVGSAYSLEELAANVYVYWTIPCEAGDIFKITTKVNTSSAKAYCILDADNKVLVLQSSAVSNSVVTIPTGGALLIVNSRNQSGDNPAVISLVGRYAKASLADDIEKINNVIFGKLVSYIGAGNTYARNNDTGINAKGGHTYRFMPVVRDWAHSSVTSTTTAFAIGYNDGAEHLMYTLPCATWEFQDYYDITFPAAADGQKIVIGGRANSGTVVSFMVSDITEKLAENRKIFIKETALSKSISTNTPTVYIPVKIESGKSYVFHYKWPTQQIVLGGSSPASSGLKIWTTNTPLDSAPQVQLLRQIHYQASSFQEEYLYFTAAGDADYLAFYCHLLSGTLSCALEIGYYPETLGVKFGGIENGYYGEKIAVHPVKNIAGENVVAVSGIGSYNSKSAQGMAIFGKYAFLTYDTGYIQILDLDTFTIVASYAMPAGVQQANNHAGMANFAYSIQSGDDFPLLYVSSYLENCCYVLRVTLSGCTLVQTISMANAYHFFVDDAGQMIVHMSDNTYNIFDIPNPNGGDVTLDPAAAKDTFTFDLVDYDYTGTICQGGKMYVLVYYKTTPPGVSGRYDRLICYDYNRKAIVSEIVFQNSKIRTIEFEGLAVNEDGYFVLEFVADQLAFIKP